MLTTRVLYAFFDPQCPHCGCLWETTKPLLGQIRVLWMPVAFMTPKSATQGAAIACRYAQSVYGCYKVRRLSLRGARFSNVRIYERRFRNGTGRC